MATLLTILGLALFEIINSIDNAVINAEVLTSVGAKARRWFLFWGLLFGVFVVRGILPWLILWLSTSLGPWEAFKASWGSDPVTAAAILASKPILLVGGGIFLFLLFLHWLFLEQKNFGLYGERFIQKHGIWFYAVSSVFLTTVVWFSIHQDPMLAFGAMIGSSAFFLVHGFKENAEKLESSMLSDKKGMSDIAKIAYLELIDACFSIDGVLGAFAFTLSIPLILIGNGIGAIVVRQITVSNIEHVKKYAFLKNGAMYSICVLSFVMIGDAFGVHIPQWFSPVVTFVVVGYFYVKSLRLMK